MVKRGNRLSRWVWPVIGCGLIAGVLSLVPWGPAVSIERKPTLTAVAQKTGEVAGVDRPISFNRDIRPILSDKCFACHGPDAAIAKHAGGFRLDRFDTATAPAASGEKPIVPGDAANSTLIERIRTDNAKLRMPPAQTKVSLTDAEVALLTRWIDEGAKYEGHWAYTKPVKPALPRIANKAWVRNEIDAFIAAELERAGLSPSPEADRTTLIRRLYLDLIGLPPTPAEIDAFINDASPDAYGKLVDSLLASDRFGERMALPWLDAARFADTIGYQLDHYRNSWPYRDWVIAAFNDNKPYNEFVVEQLAGDLLPNATDEQKLATAFCRMHMMNHEAGSIDEEYRVVQVSDRIETIATVFMAQTYTCARCHDHKYDPTTQDDYYALFDYFQSIDERGVWTNKPEHALAYGPRLNWLPEPLRAELAEARLALRAVEEQEAGQVPSQPTNASESDKPAKDSAPVSEALARARQRVKALEDRAAPISIMQELDKPREMYVLERGEYDKPIRDRPSKRVLPAFIDLPMPEGAPNNRLGFALWLTRGDHPLTARVQVNRLWQMLLGTGIVATAEDFGSQAQWPSHPQLLDYLAVSFVESGWDQKALIRQIVMSATYRQSAVVNPAAQEIDPDNRLLSYFPRHRMSGELIRDQALAVSGLLSDRIGGPSVKPYQPDGLWREVSMGPRSNTNLFKRDNGEALYRRSLYTFIKRKSPPPNLATFGTPNREACVVRRDITNTPLQVLALWNDEQFLEAARVLAQRTLAEADGDDDRLSLIYRRCTGDMPGERELAVLRDTLDYYRQRYHADAPAAADLLRQGAYPLPVKADASELASWMMVGSAVLSLDQTIVRD